MPKNYTLRNVLTHAEFDQRESCTIDPVTGDALEIVFDLAAVKTKINHFNLRHAPLGAAKYLEFYPLDGSCKVISLDEGNTPLTRAQRLGATLGLTNLYIKNEGANPTGVFKDRGSLVELTKACELGAKGVVVASTGNMAASVSAYASRAGLPCFVFIPEGTPIGKLSQTLSYGGQIIQIRGSYHDCVQMSIEFAKAHGHYLAGDYAFRLEGSKSIAFEIIEQLNWQVPDAVVCAVGCGTNLAGIWKGFDEWRQLGLIDQTPRIIGVQPTGCNTIVAAFDAGSERHAQVPNPQTVASAVGINVPQDDIKILRALRDSGGCGATATDAQILAAQKAMATDESVFTEPSGAIPVATLADLLTRGVIAADDTVVCIATGAGLKDPQAALGNFATPQSVDPDLAQIEELLAGGTVQIKEHGSGSSEQVVFDKQPGAEVLAAAITEHFDYAPQGEVLANIRSEVTEFLRKGKAVKKADLLGIVEEAQADASAPQLPLVVTDFSVTNTLRGAAQCELHCTFDGTPLSATATGVGAVDALIAALQAAVAPQTDFWPQLDDYQVAVTSADADAAVRVKMRLSRADGTITFATASSPDIIAASVMAFVKGFNLLG